MPQPAPGWTPSVRSLADDLRRRTAAEIAQLLTARPDLIRPPVADLSALAARACTRAAVFRALDRLDAGRLRVFQALALSGDPVAVEAAAAMAGTTAQRVQVDLEHFWRDALAWRSPSGWHLVRQTIEALGPYPAGLAPAHPDDAALADRVTAQALETALAAAPSPARTIVDRLVWGPPTAIAKPAGQAAAAVDHLLRAGLLRSTDVPGQVMLPRPVALALRGGVLSADDGINEPVPTQNQVGPADVAAGAGTAASALLDQMDELAQAWGAQPPRVLRSGGVGVRDLRAMAGALDLPNPQAAFLAELAYAAALLDDDGELEPVWAPTPAYDEWQALPSARRWLVLTRAWLGSGRAAHLVGRREDPAVQAVQTGDAPTRATPSPAVNALSEDVSWPPVRALRAELLADLDAVPPDAAADPEGLVARVLWRHPLRNAEPLAQAARAVLAEAGWLGLTYAGALAPPGRALQASSNEPDTAPSIPGAGLKLSQSVESVVESIVGEHLPVPIERVLFQADLTAVAPGRLEGPAARFLRLAADVESRGGATVYRFSPHSLRRCLDAGWSADQVLSALTDLAGGPGQEIPQPLAYLVTDTARRHGLIRVGVTATYLRSDDAVGLDEVLADRGLSALRLRRLAPGVAVSPSAVTTVLSMLRTHGYSPVAEDGEGAVVSAPQHHRRASGRRRPSGYVGSGAPSGTTAEADSATRADTRPTDPVLAVRVASELIAAESTRELSLGAARAAHEAADVPSCDPALTQVVLRDAVAERRPVQIGVSDASGRVRAVNIVPERVSGGRLDATDPKGARLTFSLARLTGARPL